MNIRNVRAVYFFSDRLMVCVIVLIQLLLYKWYKLPCFSFWYCVWVLFLSFLTLTLQLGSWISNKHANKNWTEGSWLNYGEMGQYWKNIIILF
jgi:hypothetical protein